MIPLLGYADRFSVAPGQTIEFKVSSHAEAPFRARLVRVRSGDPNPDGPGVSERPVSADFEGEYASRPQPVRLGSHGEVREPGELGELESFSLEALVWPTTPERGVQGILGKLDAVAGEGYALIVAADGSAAVTVGLGGGKLAECATGRPMRERTWYRLSARFDARTGRLEIEQNPLRARFGIDDAGSAMTTLEAPAHLAGAGRFLVAAFGREPAHHYNGKIEAPAVYASATAAPANLLAAWDFSLGISSDRMVDGGPRKIHGRFHNVPARGMKGAAWTGVETCWRHAPHHYAAVHFHDDDLYDCAWQTDFSYTVPDDLPSGVYAARLECGDEHDMIPFFVRAPAGQPGARACVLIPTFTYIVYGNMARGVTDEAYLDRARAWGASTRTPDLHPEYGLSTYNLHSDGSGICYSSRLRPLMNIRSAFLAYIDPHGSGLRHFPADLHLIDWLEALGHEYDVITDEDLHDEGRAAISGYKVVMTTTHPEYHTPRSLDALQDYVDTGGRLMYLGGNGFYWKVAVNEDSPGLVEIRRGEGGIRAWAADPGEYWNSLDGTYGGLWRRNDRPPQHLAGIGFTSQGPFEASHYRRTEASRDPDLAWMFEGIDGDVIGDFGLSGGGAAGFELDRTDVRLGTPPNAVVVAKSEGHKDDHILVHEDMLTNVLTVNGESPESLIRADMTYFETANDGAVFSVGSITFCGSLAHDGYANPVSRLIANVLTRFQSDPESDGA